MQNSFIVSALQHGCSENPLLKLTVSYCSEKEFTQQVRNMLGFIMFQNIDLHTWSFENGM